MSKLSIIIPIYNEKNTLLEIISRIEKSDIGNMTKEIILVDDGSTDGVRNILKKLENKYKVIYQKKNKGKGAAVRAGFKEATGDIVLIQDADLEYNPNEYFQLLKPILDDEADVVYGSRFTGIGAHRVLFYWHNLGNRFLTTLSNIFTNLNLTDIETCYKVFKKKVIDEILPKLKSNRFGFEPEVTARIAKTNYRVYEVGISYHGRTYKEGKKINWKDGIKAFFSIIYFNLFSR
jgi:glycosyltransferase involved in cell wall biosynthesis